MKSVVVDSARLRLGRDEPLERPFNETVILRDARRRLHAAIRAPESRKSRRGTYVGLIEKIPYLQSLGLDRDRASSVFQFDEQDAPAGLSNYWGYSPVSFFAPHRGFSSRKDPLGPVDEFGTW
jgi:glycogen operon protein